MRVTEIVLSIGMVYLFGVIGCNNGKQIGKENIEVIEEVEELDEDDVKQDIEYTYGKVTTAYEADGCNYLIQLKETIGDDIRFLLPIGLDEEYLTDGTTLKFTYTFSRAPSGNCYIGTPAILSNVIDY